MRTQRYGTFLQEIDRRSLAARVPVSGSIEVSRRCPLSCVQCYNCLPMDDGAARSRELSLAEHRRILDEIADAGCLWLLYTGGEIFARPDFLDIYTHAKRNGLLLTLFTNGTLITPRIADHLAQYRPLGVEVTLYGASPTTYERVTGVPGSYARCLRGIELLLERKLPLKLKTLGLSLNRHELGEMRGLAERLGVSFAFDAEISPRIDCSPEPLGVRLAPADVVALDLQDAERMNEWRRLAARHSEQGSAGPMPEQLYDCGAGLLSFAIDPEGMLTLCVISHRDRYDLRRGSFREGWDRFLLEVRSRTTTRRTRCLECGLRWMCGSCPATGHLETGDPEGPVEFLCETSHLRAYALDLPVPPHGDCPCCEGGTAHARLASALASFRPAGWAELATDGRRLGGDIQEESQSTRSRAGGLGLCPVSSSKNGCS